MPSRSIKISALLNVGGSLERLGLIVERGTTGEVVANVAHIPCHSPAGFDCGFNGAGPADLALATLNELLPAPSKEAEDANYRLDSGSYQEASTDLSLWGQAVGPNQVRVSRLAWTLHHRFKTHFIAPMREEGGHVPIETIREWLEEERSRLTQRA